MDHGVKIVAPASIRVGFVQISQMLPTISCVRHVVELAILQRIVRQNGLAKAVPQLSIRKLKLMKNILA